MEFHLDPQTITRLSAAVDEVTYTRNNERDVVIMALDSLPGGGKTRLLLELLPLLEGVHDFQALYMTTYSDSSYLCSFVRMEEIPTMASRSIAMRILYQAVLTQQIRDNKPWIDFNEWLRKVEALGTINSIEEAIQLLGRE